MISGMKTQRQLMVVAVDGELRPAKRHRDSNSEYSFTADMPRGSALLPEAMSPTDEGARSQAAPISASDIPDAWSARTLTDHESVSVLTQQSLRRSVDKGQRHSVTEFRLNPRMANRPADLPRLATIGQRVRYWREKHKITRAKLAQMVGAAGPSTISDLELDRTKRPIDLYKFTKPLRVSLRYLETDNWEEPEELPQSAGGDDPPTAQMQLDVDPARLEQLDPIERELVSMKVNALLDQIEAARPRTRRKQSAG